MPPAIEKQRRGLPEESGLYTYDYDPLGRLSKVTKDGEMLRTYGYDAFGNRTHMTEGDREAAYTYNAMNQLMSRMDSMSEETYAYDRRGNLSLIMENGSLKNSYTYGALNRLEQAVNGNGEAEAEKLLIEDMREQAPVELMETLDDNEIYLKPNERDALVSLFFQLGRNTSSSDESPNFRKLLLSGNFDNEEIIISEFLTYGGNNSNYSGNRKRRIAEAEMILFGTYDLEFYERCVGD